MQEQLHANRICTRFVWTFDWSALTEHLQELLQSLEPKWHYCLPNFGTSVCRLEQAHFEEMVVTCEESEVTCFLNCPIIFASSNEILRLTHTVVRPSSSSLQSEGTLVIAVNKSKTICQTKSAWKFFLKVTLAPAFRVVRLPSSVWRSWNATLHDEDT